MLKELGFDVDDGSGSDSGDGGVGGKETVGRHRKIVNGAPRRARREKSRE